MYARNFGSKKYVLHIIYIINHALYIFIIQNLKIISFYNPMCLLVVKTVYTLFEFRLLETTNLIFFLDSSK
jgi:hypothetical protein